MAIHGSVVVLACLLMAHIVAPDMSTFEQSIQHLVNNVLHVEDMQNVLDNQVTVTSEPVNGATIISQLSATLTTKINERFQLVKSLQQTVTDSYSSFYSIPANDLCCQHKSSFSRMDDRFKAVVNKEEMCVRKSSLADVDAKYATGGLLQQFINNMRAVPGVKYQYLGTQQGLLFSYPATRAADCDTYDPRFRPWYVGTATPVAKDIVLVIDISGSMVTPEGGGHTRIEIAKAAAKTVLDTLNPSDRVGIVAFSAYGDTYTDQSCYRDELSVANPSNKRLLAAYVDSLGPGGESYYSRGLERAFTFYTNSSYTGDFAGIRKKAILFLTDGSPTENMAFVTSLITEKEGLLGNDVTIMPYGIGSVTTVGREALNVIASTAQNTQATPVVVTEMEELRRAMGSYYTFFGNSNINTPVLATPYFDAFGLGLITTVSLPVYHDSALIGVVGLDISLSDLFEDISYFEQDAKTYAFVASSNGMALSHPMLPVPMNIKDDPVSVKLELLEKYTNVVDIIADMMSGGDGTLTTPTTIIQPRGNGKTDGIAEVAYNADYHWAQIQDNTTSADILCVAVKIATDYARTTEALTTRLTAATTNYTVFTYHSYRLMPERRAVCAHFKCKAIVGDSVVKFSPQAFVRPFVYTDTTEDEETVSQYNSIMLRNQTNAVFKDGVVDTVEISSKIHDFWFPEIENFAVWRYVAFANGVLRITPGTELQKDYNPTERNWYKRALAFPGKYVMSSPYLDAFGAGFVISFTHVLFTGVPLAASHASTEPTEGVMGMDVSVNYFYYTLMENFPECTLDANKCFIVDSGGYLVVHSAFVDVPGPENPLNDSLHITIKEKGVADYLIRNGHMVKKSCQDPNSLIEHHFYEIDLDTVTSVSSTVEIPNFEMQLIPGTNAYFVMRQTDYTSPECPCLDEVEDSPVCPATITDCMCPCGEHIPASYQPCQNYYLYNTLADFKVCPPEGAKLNINILRNRVIESTAACYPVRCSRYGNNSMCYQYPQCNWCMRGITGFPLGLRSSCQTYSACYFGQIEYRSPYNEITEAVVHLTDSIILILWLFFATVTMVMLLVLGCYVANVLTGRRAERAAVDAIQDDKPKCKKHYVNTTFDESEFGVASDEEEEVEAEAPRTPSGFKGYGAAHHKPTPNK